MKKLHLIGFTPDDGGLILSPRKGAKSGGFVVVLDEELLSSIERARRRRDGEDPDGEGSTSSGGGGRGTHPPRPRSSLSPREIQARLRAGSSIAEVASQAGVDEEWILRFAAPILAEQAQVVASAQRLTLVKSRRGPSIEPLAPSVQWNLSDRGVLFSDDVFADSWSAYNLHGARWAVRFAYTSRKRRHVAEWEVDLRERSLVARNRLATDLGHVEEGRRRPSTEPSDPGALDTAPAGQTTKARSAPTKAASRGGPGRPATAAAGKARVATKVAPRAATTKAGAPRTAGVTKAAATKAAATKAAATKAAATKAASGSAGRGAGTRPTRATATAGPVKAASAPSVGKAAAARVAGAARAGAAATGAAKRGTAKSVAAKSLAAKSVAAKRAGRESSPRKARPAKKPTADKPVSSSTGSVPPAAATEAPSDRPSHLARPPSPMKMANRATSYPSQRLTDTYARQAPPRPESARPPRPAPSPPSATNHRFDPGPAPAREQGSRRTTTPPPGPSRAGNGRPPEPTAAAAVSPVRSAETPVPVPPVAAPDRPGQGRRSATSGPAGAGGGVGGQDRPAVVILSTPAARPAGAGPETSEGRARLASAERRRASLTGAAPDAGAAATAVSGAERPATPGGDDAGRPATARRQAPGGT